MLILAAGLGTRMKASAFAEGPSPDRRKRPMLRHLLASCEAVFDRIVVVVGPDMAAVERLVAPHRCVVRA